MSQNFDLLGDPIPEGWGKRGRPAHIATVKNRNKVILLLALGWTNARIASALGITQPTLRKNYFQELRAREVARDRLDAARYELAWELAKEGNVAAFKELGRMIDASDLKLTQDAYRDDRPEEQKPEKPLGKKEMAAIEAETAGEDSEWGDDLRFRTTVQ